MASLVPHLIQGSFQNWLKGALGVLFAKEGLTDFVRTELLQFQIDLLQLIWTSTRIPAGTTCNVCTTANLQRGQPCPNRICDALMKEIRKEHRFNNPSWKNTDARGWCTDAFELSKCFMPPDGYSRTRTFEDTDFNGTLSVIINNKRFQSKFMATPNKTPMTICKKAREIGRTIRHSPDLLLTDADLAQYITDLIVLLSDPKSLAFDPKAQAAVNKLNQLQTNNLTIHANDITQIIHDNIGRSISRQHQALLQDITSHLSTVKTASITVIDKISKAKVTALNEIKIKSEQIKREIEVHMCHKKRDIDKNIETMKHAIDKHADQKKQDIDKHIDTKKQDIDIHADQKKQEIDKQTNTKKLAIDIHAYEQKQDIDKHIYTTKLVIDIHTDQKKQDIDKHTETKKQGIDKHIYTKKLVIDIHTDKKKQDIDKHKDTKKLALDIHTYQKKQDIDKHTDTKKHDIDTQADQKKQDIDKYTDTKKHAFDTQADQKKKDIDKHTETKKQGIDEHTDTKKLVIDIHTDQKKQDIDKHKDTKKLALDIHAYQKKQDIDIHAYQKKTYIDRHTETKKQAIDIHADQKKKDINVHINQRKQDIDSHIEQKKQYLDEYIDQKKKKDSQITDTGLLQRSQIQEAEYAGFQKRLIEFYRQEHSMTSVSPLVEEHEVPLVEFYVKPQLVAVDLQHGFGNPTMTPVLNYEQLFCWNMKKVYTNIYVTSSAGMGKTSFCKHICITWCQAHNPFNSTNNKFKPEDIRAMLGFQFLFYITMRDVQRSQCHIDDLIESFVKEILPKQAVHSLQQILDDNPCLVVLDGLDEWIHPEKCDRRKNEHDIPHRKFRKNWTILTTTRSWKFDILHLPSNQIDSHIELNELDNISSTELVQNAIYFLNNKFKSGKTIEEFYSATTNLKLGEIRKIPYLHLHCVCLWYDGRDIGKSKCEIYSNILELTLHRGTQKLQLRSFPEPIQQKGMDVPKCWKDNYCCVQHQSMLLKVGELAFFALFGSENRLMLVVDYKFATNYLKPDELEYCLKLGLLSQNKVYGLVSRRISNISFQHKTIQEYMAAFFYMQSTLEDPTCSSQHIRQLVVQTCTTLSRILEMSEVFIFLSGFSSKAYRDISWQLINNVNEDEHIQRYRSRFHFKLHQADYEVMSKYQTLLVDCAEEMELNGQHFYALPLQDIIINEQSKQAEIVPYIKTLMQGNIGGIKSLHVREFENTEEVTNIFYRLDLQYCFFLDNIRLSAVARQPDIGRLLQQSVNTLRSLAINNVNYKQRRYIPRNTVFSQVCTDTVLGMPLLQSLSLSSLILKHNQLENLTTFLTSRVTITQIRLQNITCSDHDKYCPGVQFKLSGHVNLQLLGQANIPVSQLHANTQNLEECSIGSLPSRLIASCLTSLRNAYNLHILHCSCLTGPNVPSLIVTLSALLQLERLFIRYTDLTDNNLHLKREMINLEYIELLDVSMTSSSFRALIHAMNLLSQSVTVHLINCTVTPDVEYQTVKGSILHSGNFTVIFDGMHRLYGKTFKFKTIK